MVNYKSTKTRFATLQLAGMEDFKTLTEVNCMLMTSSNCRLFCKSLISRLPLSVAMSSTSRNLNVPLKKGKGKRLFNETLQQCFMI